MQGLEGLSREDGEERGFSLGLSRGNRPGSQKARFVTLHRALCSDPGMFFSRCHVVELEKAGLWGQTHPSSKPSPGLTSTGTSGKFPTSRFPHV